MPKKLETALNQCLALMAAGHSIAECLDRYPGLRGELEPLLRTAALVQASHRPPESSPIALARARNLFLADAARRGQSAPGAQAAAKTKQRAIPGLRLALSPGLATALLTLLVVIGVLGGGGMVSANSLPGNPLYGVKRASETVRLALTTNPLERDELEQLFAARRVQEVKVVVERRQSAHVEFGGTVSAIEGEQAVIDGVVVSFAGQTLPEVGAQVSLKAQTRDDGTVQASAVTVESTPAKPTATPIPVENVPTAKPTDKPKPTNTALPSPTSTREPIATATLSSTLAVSATVVLTATPTETSTQIPSPTCTHTATATPPPPPRDVKVRIEGQIDEIAGGYWRVAGKQVFLVGTRINQDKARAAVGGRAVVDALEKPDGRLEAVSIVVLRGPEQVPEPKEFSGRIDSISGDTWVVGGRTVNVGSAQIEGQPRVGAQASVKADQYADGRLVARQITVQAPEEQVVHFGGVVQSFSDSSWVVAGQRVAVTSETRISGTPQVGAIAEVEAVVQADGSRVARKISVKAPPEPTSAPTTEPTDAPAAEPTAEPTLAATVEPTTGPEATATLEETARSEPTAEAGQVPGAIPEAPTPSPTAEGGTSTVPSESLADELGGALDQAPTVPDDDMTPPEAPAGA